MENIKNKILDKIQQNISTLKVYFEGEEGREETSLKNFLDALADYKFSAREEKELANIDKLKEIWLQYDCDYFVIVKFNTPSGRRKIGH